MRISSAFESGNITVESLTDSTANLRLRIDSGHGTFRQWYYFSLSDCVETSDICLRIIDAKDATFDRTWPKYRSLVSIDGEHWTRTNTEYDENTGVLTIRHHVTSPTLYFAFGPPYLSARRKQTIDRCRADSVARVWTIGESEKGVPLDVVSFGKGETQVWIVARQHAGESHAEYVAEGMIDALVNAPSDPILSGLLRNSTVHLLTCVNPDGAALGNLRCNSRGIDLNRAWHHAPQDSDCPAEIRAVKAAMHSTKTDYFIDLHSDEERPFLWALHPSAHAIGPQQPDYAHIQSFFEEQLIDIGAPVVGTAPQYVIDDLCGLDVTVAQTLAVNKVAQEHRCQAWVLEMPFCEPNPPHPTESDPFLPPNVLQWGKLILTALANTIEYRQKST